MPEYRSWWRTFPWEAAVTIWSFCALAGVLTMLSLIAGAVLFEFWVFGTWPW